MRPILFICLFSVLSSLAAYGQNPKPFRQVPDTIYKAFCKTWGKDHNKRLTNLKWDLENRRYTASFNIKNDNYVITFNPDGSIYKGKSGVIKKDLPDHILTEVAKYGKLIQAWQIINTNEYEVETDSMFLWFNTFGQLITSKPTH
jgi:hypothetical protein